jgi:hypothetical protein
LPRARSPSIVSPRSSSAGAGPVEVPPPQQAREGTGRDERGDNASWEPLAGVERHDDRQTDGDDHLAESNDHDECVTLGEVTGSHGPVSATGVDHRPDHDGCARNPDDDAPLAADEGTGEQDDEGHNVERDPPHD